MKHLLCTFLLTMMWSAVSAQHGTLLVNADPTGHYSLAANGATLVVDSIEGDTTSATYNVYTTDTIIYISAQTTQGAQHGNAQQIKLFGGCQIERGIRCWSQQPNMPATEDTDSSHSLTDATRTSWITLGQVSSSDGINLHIGPSEQDGLTLHLWRVKPCTPEEENPMSLGAKYITLLTQRWDTLHTRFTSDTSQWRVNDTSTLRWTGDIRTLRGTPIVRIDSCRLDALAATEAGWLFPLTELSDGAHTLRIEGPVFTTRGIDTLVYELPIKCTAPAQNDSWGIVLLVVVLLFISGLAAYFLRKNSTSRLSSPSSSPEGPTSIAQTPMAPQTDVEQTQHQRLQSGGLPHMPGHVVVQTDIDAPVRTVKALEGKIGSLSADKEAQKTQAGNKGLHSQLEEAKKQLEAAKKQFEDTRKQLDTVNTQATNLRNELKEAQATARRLQAEQTRHENELDEARRKSSEALRLQKVQLDKERTAALQAQENELTRALRSKEDEHAAALQAKVNEFTAALQAKEDAHAAALQAKENEHTTALQVQADELTAAMQAKEDEHTAALQTKDKQHAEELATKQQTIDKLTTVSSALCDDTIRQVRHAIESARPHISALAANVAKVPMIEPIYVTIATELRDDFETQAQEMERRAEAGWRAEGFTPQELTADVASLCLSHMQQAGWINRLALLESYSHVPQLADTLQQHGIAACHIEQAAAAARSLMGIAGLALVVPSVLASDFDTRYYDYAAASPWISKFFPDTRQRDHIGKVFDIVLVGYMRDGQIARLPVVCTP